MKQIIQSLNVLNLLVNKKKNKSSRDCEHVSVGLNVVYLKLYTGSDQPERQAGTCTVIPNEVMAFAIPANPSVLHTSAGMNLDSPCFHSHVLSLGDSFSACALHTHNDTAVCCDNPEQVFKYWAL